MFEWLKEVAYALSLRFKSRARLEAENLVLRQQVNILIRKLPKRLQLTNSDRLLLVWLYRLFPSILSAIRIVRPETVIRWHRRGFRAYWRWKSRPCVGRPPIDGDIRELIRQMSMANPLWGAPRIHGELHMLGIDVAQSTVAKYMVPRSRRPPSQNWKTFLRNHAAGIASIDLFVVPTAFFKLLYGLVILSHERRRLIGFGVTAHPTAEWIARQVTEAFPWDEAPGYLIRDRDGAFGPAYIRRVRAMGIRDRPTAPRSPWQNGHAERLIGSIRRDCLDHVIVFGEGHLRHALKAYASYYNQVRTHLSLDKDAPEFRQAQPVGAIVALPLLGGLHHHYVRV
jgi:transposase InsO family protein